MWTPARPELETKPHARGIPVSQTFQSAPFDAKRHPHEAQEPLAFHYDNTRVQHLWWFQDVGNGVRQAALGKMKSC